MFAIIKLLIAVWLVDKIHGYLGTIGIDGGIAWLFAIVIPFAALIAWSMVTVPNQDRGNGAYPYNHNNNDNNSDGY